jgi:LysR family transcriptional regulator, chromosome initiation inhibitor
MLDYASLAAVATVINEGSFERAARMLNVTPSAVSQRVKLLEERLGRILIARGQPCTATDAGRLLCRHIERVGMLEQDLRAVLPQLANTAEDRGRLTLRVAVNADSLGTWFVPAIAAFAQHDSACLDVALDDQDYTIEWLRTGSVLAAVTAHSQAVQGCNSVALGQLGYGAVASPEFVNRYFADGITADSLTRAPRLTFSRKDSLQAQWMRRICRKEIDAPTHWLPSTQAFVDATLAGIGWAMNPLTLVRPHLQSGALVELIRGRRLQVPLYWQHTRLRVPMLDRLTAAVIRAATESLDTRRSRR